MPQETNFNVSPYFDDFDKDKDYYRVLFKPGYPIQARELTTLQSMLQNQIENFGNKFLKEGEIVIPGNVSYNNPTYAVEIDPSFNGLPINLYFSELKGKKIKGLNSGVTAEIYDLITNSESERGNYTLYVKYLESGGEELNIKRFQDGETLLSLDSISYGENKKFVIQQNQEFLNTISINSTSESSSVSISEGVAFIRGFFVNFGAQNLILDQYSTESSYKVGFDIVERIVTSDEDESLYDNARNFSNYTAPGADRLKFELFLAKKELIDTEIDNFVELMRVVDGIPIFPDVNRDETKPALTAKTESAKAVSDTSGDFFVKPFSVNVRDGLNDGLLNNGIYFEDQSTVGGETPTEDKFVYQIGPGKAYIGGYVVETVSSRLLDVEKPRDTDTCTKETVQYTAGNLVVLNNTYGTPPIGIGTNLTVSLMTDRLGLDKSVASGTTIGLARVYDFVPESSYENNLSRMHLRLFDVQTFTKLNFLKSVPVYSPSFFRGSKSNATGHALDVSPKADIQTITFPSVGIGTIQFETGFDLAELTLDVDTGLSPGDVVFLDNISDVDASNYLSYEKRGPLTVSASIGRTFSVNFNTNASIYGSLDNDASSLPSDISTLDLSAADFVVSTAIPTVNSTSHGFNPGDEIYIFDTSNSYFNKRFIIDTTPTANTYTLLDVSAINSGIQYFGGVTSSTGGEALVGITSVRLYEVNGKFAKNEGFSVNGIDQGRLIDSITDYDLSQVKSVFSDDTVETVSSFNADVILENTSSLAPAGTLFKVTVTDLATGISTISTATPKDITTNLKVGDIVSYSNPNAPESTNGRIPPTYNKVVSINSNGRSFEVIGVSTVTDYIDGSTFYGGDLEIEVTNVEKVSSSLYGDPEEESLLTRLNNENISSIDFEENTITQRISFKNVTIVNSTVTISIDPADEDVFFASFDEDRYVINYSDGSIEVIRFDKFNIDSTGKSAQFVGLSQSSGSADVIATVTNFKLNSKTKKFNSVSVLNVSRSKFSGSGSTIESLEDGLTFSRVYGTRIQDEEISLNVPDAVRVLAIFESSDSSLPILPSLQISGTNAQSYVLGEYIVGESSGAIGILVEKTNTSVLEFVYLNSKTFIEGEVILGKKSTLKTNITAITIGSKNITQNFEFDDGQTNSYYGYSSIIRKSKVDPPKRSLKIVFQNYSVDSSDTGELFTANSYNPENYKYDVPIFDDTRNSDYIDLRARVSKYDLSSNRSPFEFYQRDFSGQGQYAKYILAPNELLQVCYKYYVGRVDKIILNPNGSFGVLQGEPSLSPIEPETPDGCLEIATINLPPFVFNVDSIEVDVENHKKYTMQDIGLLEDRIRRLEEYTILTALETSTENLKIQDAETGLDRFKCGFFVDTFKNTALHDEEDPDYSCAIDDVENVLRPTHYTTALDMQLGSEVISGVGATFKENFDHDFVTDLGSNGIRKTGDLITLNYEDQEYFDQPYATRTESVTPFLVKYWTGTITLNPPSDSWIEEREIVNRSFQTRTETLPALPDINITVTNNITRNRRVFRNRVVTQRGIWWRRWINSRGMWVRRGRWWNRRRFFQSGVNLRRFLTRGTGRLSSRIVNQNGRQAIQFRVRRGNLTGAEFVFLRRVLPRDVAEGFITRIRNRRRNFQLFMLFAPGEVANRRTRTVSTTVRTTRTTNTTVIPPQIREETTVDEQVSNFTEPTRFLRSRNIEFDVKGLRPRTRFYSFFEGIDVSRYIVPKLLEIEMVSGKFQIGETVESDPHFTAKKIRFRLCNPNHKIGPFSSPTETFSFIPYRQSEPPVAYTEASDYLNVDTRALELSSEIDFYGEVAVNMQVIGKTSGAVARITNIRLVSDNSGRLIGSLFVPDPKVQENPKWINGENTFTVIDTPSLSEVASGDSNVVNESSAEEDFTSSSITNVTQRNITTTRNIIITPARNVNTTRITNVRTNTTAITNTRIRGRRRRLVRNWEVWDPLAQSFYVKDETGVFITGVDVYFETKDESLPVTMQLRTMENGTPTTTVFPFSEITLDPSQINLSVDGSVPTRFTFASPIYLSGPQAQEVRGAPIASDTSAEYCVVLLSNSSNYRVFISRLGENDIITNIKIGAQPTLGSLFKSQNGSTWTPTQLEDLKYKLYRADFVESGTVRYFNPLLGLKNGKVSVLGENQITTLSKKNVLRLEGSENIKPEVVPGVTIFQPGNAKGKLVGVGGSISTGFGVTVTNAGVGYTPASGTFTFDDVSLETISGSGVGAVGNVKVTDGKIVSIDITSGGYGYDVGDYLKVPSIGTDVGFGGEVLVDNISIRNTLIVDNIEKGNTLTATSAAFFGSGDILYLQNSGIGTYVTTNRSRLKSDGVIQDPFYDGAHIRLDVLNHGNHSSQNLVRISNVRPEEDEPNSVLTNSITSTENNIIDIGDTTGFEIFEGSAVTDSNPGYVIIGTEVVGYTTYTSTALGGGPDTIQRGVDGTESQPYATNIPVYRYEFNGVSLRRINKIHPMGSVNQEIHKTKLNSFYLKINSSDTDEFDNTIGFPLGSNMTFNETKGLGDSGSIVSTNIPYEILTPNFAHVIPSQTNITTKVRTFSGTSIDGNEVSFEDQGFESMSISEAIKFPTPRLVASVINEKENLKDSGVPGNRSLSMEFDLTTQDSRVSPIIDDVTTGVILTSNLINAPAGIGEDSSFADVDYIRGGGDEHTAIYISKPISLKLPANSLKVLLKSARSTENDVRVLYKLFRKDSPSGESNYEPFPGYSNYEEDSSGILRVVDASKNDGSEDVKSNDNSSSEYQDYEYTIDNLEDFTGFSIKIIMASENQADPPYVKDLRAIATLKPSL